jgi:hypothetical protein
MGKQPARPDSHKIAQVANANPVAQAFLTVLSGSSCLFLYPVPSSSLRNVVGFADPHALSLFSLAIQTQ